MDAVVGSPQQLSPAITVLKQMIRVEAVGRKEEEEEKRTAGRARDRRVGEEMVGTGRWRRSAANRKATHSLAN